MIFLNAGLFLSVLREACKFQMRNWGLDSAVLFAGKAIKDLVIYSTVDCTVPSNQSVGAVGSVVSHTRVAISFLWKNTCKQFFSHLLLIEMLPWMDPMGLLLH